jgi:hypothetical protein
MKNQPEEGDIRHKITKEAPPSVLIKDLGNIDWSEYEVWTGSNWISME